MSQQVGAKKRKYGQYTQATLELAVSAVQTQAMSLRAAARTYAVPRETLFDKVAFRTPMVATPKTVLTPAEEKMLVDWAIHMGRIGYCRTRGELLDTVKKILDSDGRKNPFTKNRPGKDWWYAFIRRHPELSERTHKNIYDNG